MRMMDTIRAKRDEIYAVARRHKAEKLWVFGSCARGEETPESDVDLLVEFAPDSAFGAPLDLTDAVQSIIGRTVDVVSARGLSPYIGKRIRREAVAV